MCVGEYVGLSVSVDLLCWEQTKKCFDACAYVSLCVFAYVRLCVCVSAFVCDSSCSCVRRSQQFISALIRAACLLQRINRTVHERPPRRDGDKALRRLNDISTHTTACSGKRQTTPAQPNAKDRAGINAARWLEEEEEGVLNSTNVSPHIEMALFSFALTPRGPERQ